MLALTIASSFSVGELFTGTSILVSIIALLYAWHKDQKLRKQEYADRIRRAGSSVTAKLERWRELSLSFFAEIQPLFVDVDALLLKQRDLDATRDSLWRGLTVAYAESLRRIREEQIEIAYADLYGYNAKARELFSKVVGRLKKIYSGKFSDVLAKTQANVRSLRGQEKTVVSADLGNALREPCRVLNEQLAKDLDDVIDPFRKQMIKLIEASDSDLVKKNVDIFPSKDA